MATKIVLNFIVLLFIVGCTNNKPKYTIGTEVLVHSGFFIGCQGFITEYDDDHYKCNHGQYRIDNVKCHNVEKNFEFVCAEDIE